MKLRQTHPTAVATAKASISVATAYRIETDPRLPSQKQTPRGRRRPDPLADIFDAEVVPLLKAAPGIRPVAIFEEMMRRHPELGGGVRRTLERRIRSWRAIHGGNRRSSFARRTSRAASACRISPTWLILPSWERIFPDPAMTLAAVDRLVHHATIFEMNVESYRRRETVERRNGPGRPASYATPANTAHD